MNETFFRRLLEINRQMAENRALEPLLRVTMQNALELLDAESGYLVLLNADGQLDFRVKMDRAGNELAHPEEQISSSIFNKVIETREPLLINDAILDPSLSAAESVRALQLRSVMCAPLLARGTLLGAIYVENRSTANVFKASEVDSLVIFANQAAISIENAMLNDELEARVQARTAELEAALRQLERSWAEAVEANRIRTMVLGNVAHDVRAPIALSISALAAIREGAFGSVNTKQRDWIERALKSMNHAIALTADLFDLMKAEMGELVIHREPVEIAAFLNETFRVAESLRWQEGVVFDMVLGDDLPVLEIDPTRIKQVIMNLLTNAQKFTHKGSVVLYAQRDANKDALLIGVRDTGDGVPLHLSEAIFQRFQQASPDAEKRRQGTGLGLAICRELVERHGGRIWLEPSERGSDFRFTLPLNGA